MKWAIVCGLILATIFQAGQFNAERPEQDGKRFHEDHASIRAYDNAVITARDNESGITFYVESNGTRLVAIDDTRGVIWTFDAAEGMDDDELARVIGQPVIRHLQIHDNYVVATFAKKTKHYLDLKTGKWRLSRS